MTFSVLKTYPVLPSTFCTPFFRLNKFLSSFGKFYFRIFNLLLLHSSRYTPSIKPQPAMFCTQYANDFANPANPFLIPVFPFVRWTMARGGGGGRGVKCEEGGSVFNHEFPLIRPPKLILFNPLHCHKKSIHAAGNHHWSRHNIRLIRTAWL
jgi:hypothetical protein